VSLDTELFSSRPILLGELTRSLPRQGRGRQYDGDALAYEADRWQLIVGETETVHPQDVPADLRELLPAIRYGIGVVNFRPERMATHDPVAVRPMSF